MSIYFDIFKNILDIVITTIIIYQVLKFIIKSEKMIFIVNAIILIAFVYLFALILDLNTVKGIMSNVFSWGIVLIFILFQNEIRASLEKIGSKKRKDKSQTSNDYVNQVVEAVMVLSEEKIGALITFEKEMSLSDYTEKAVSIGAYFSPHLLISMFTKESPLHDGAVIIKDKIITHASTYFPIGLELNMDKKYGTRHRSALTLSSQTDALVVIVSEENGKISIAYKGNLYTDLEEDFLIEFLKSNLEN